MASLIPVSGEISEISPPKSETEITRLLGSPGHYSYSAPDGSTWWTAKPLPVPENERATRFYNARSGTSGLLTLRGEVLYLSADETLALAVPSKEEYVPVRGRTYDVKEKLKAIGARWHGDEKVWKVPKSVLADAEEIVRRGP